MPDDKNTADRDPFLDAKSNAERLADGDEGTRPVEDYSIDEKITPPAEQTRAARPTVIGVAADATEGPGTEPGLAPKESRTPDVAPKAKPKT